MDMAEQGQRREIFDQYFALQQQELRYVTQNTSQDRHTLYLLKTLKQMATPRMADNQMNIAQVVLNTRGINRIIGQIQSSPAKLKSKVSSSARQQVVGAPFKFDDSTKLIQEGEQLVESDDLSAQTSDYLLTIAGAQEIGGELETLATELQNEKVTDPIVLSDVQNSMVSMEGRAKGFLGRLADRAKAAGESLWNMINGVKNQAKNVTTNIRGFIVSSIKKIADKLREFVTALVGAIFDLAAWIQSIAMKKNFTIKEFAIEVQPLEVSTVAGISIPKFNTPKLSVSFSPQNGG